MPKKGAPPPGDSVAFVELASQNPTDTLRFLRAVFGWEFESTPMPAGEYHSFRTPDGGRGGVRATQPSEPPSSTSYVRVADLGEAQHKVERAGGRIVLPRVDVPGMGSFFWFQVPSGPVMACWQDARPTDLGR